MITKFEPQLNVGATSGVIQANLDLRGETIS